MAEGIEKISGEPAVIFLQIKNIPVSMFFIYLCRATGQKRICITHYYTFTALQDGCYWQAWLSAFTKHGKATAQADFSLVQITASATGRLPYHTSNWYWALFSISKALSYNTSGTTKQLPLHTKRLVFLRWHTVH